MTSGEEAVSSKVRKLSGARCPEQCYAALYPTLRKCEVLLSSRHLIKCSWKNDVAPCHGSDRTGPKCRYTSTSICG